MDDTLQGPQSAECVFAGTRTACLKEGISGNGGEGGIGLARILAEHRLWLDREEGGERADLSDADLRDADLRDADLRDADLRGVDLRHADLRHADLRHADLSGADLHGADLRYVDLRGAKLYHAVLRGADLDHSCWPLWCGSKEVIVDRSIAAQLAAHLCALVCDDADYQAAREALLPFARTSHRARDLGLLEDEGDR